ncbi:hypothetical protein FJT64_016636 [Amphibalanus amphitrite]|uniref:ATR-interacting protein n=1 Tax=Amphibalanus amphitrite TaxID=1232801 RepID=A0A6A4WZZ2_AMPAM|nr:hypothetical protein FJT64_016636 [Amphibalanus amphitrite]
MRVAHWSDIAVCARGQRQPPVAAPSTVRVPPPEPAAPLSELQQLRRDHQALSDQLRAAKADKYTQQGQVSVLREELTRRCRELENCRLESSRQLQEQHSCLEQSTAALNKELETLRTELQFKSHELAEVTRQYRALRDSPGRAASPPRKAPRLDSADQSFAAARRFVTSSEFRRPEKFAARTETSGTQTDPDPEESQPDGDEVAAHQLVLSVLRACADCRWLDGAALSELADPDPQRASGAAHRLAAAATGRLAAFSDSVERLRATRADDRQVCTLGSGRRRTAARQALQQEETAAVAALTALRRLAEWSAPLAARLAADRPLTELLPRLLRPAIAQVSSLSLLRPAIAQGEVTNAHIMEHTAVLLATMAGDTLPDELFQALCPVVHEVFNTKPPSRLLLALLELLISAAGTGQIAGLWCRAAPPPAEPPARKHTGTCLMKKLNILCCERGAPSDPPSPSSYRLPASHSRHGPQRQPLTTGRADLSSQQGKRWKLSAAGGACDARWLRLVGLLVWRPAALPPQACCRAHLTLLVVQLLHAAVRHWQHGGADEPSAVLLLLSALHRLADLDAEFSVSVSRERLRYLVTMETLGRCWREMRLTAQHVGVLQELYKFQPGTFEGAGLLELSRSD